MQSLSHVFFFTKAIKVSPLPLPHTVLLQTQLSLFEVPTIVFNYSGIIYRLEKIQREDPHLVLWEHQEKLNAGEVGLLTEEERVSLCNEALLNENPSL